MPIAIPTYEWVSVAQLRWICRRTVSIRKKKASRCETFVSYRMGTFFARSQLSFYQILGFVNFWVHNIPLVFIAIQLGISLKSAVDWASFCREVVHDAIFTHKEKLGGLGVIVEIDEFQFGHQRNHQGHRVEDQWVLGGFERGTGRVFMVAVERGADTLLSIVQEWILPGTTIISDCWRTYDCLQQEGFIHLMVNHSLTFKDPDSGAHMKHIKASWRAAKAVCGGAMCKRTHIPGNLARYMFYKRCTQLQLSRTTEFYRLAGQLYNPVNVGRHEVGDNNAAEDDHHHDHQNGEEDDDDEGL